MELTPEGPIYGRGDYGCHYASDTIEHVEHHNCRHGCTNSGTAADRAEFGPGGNCELLARLVAELPIPQFRPDPEHIVCTARIDPQTAGMEPLFEVAGGAS